MEWDELPALFPMFGDSSRWLPLLQSHQALIVEAEPHTRVTSVAHRDAVQRHYAESLETWRLAVQVAGHEPAIVVDVGSGGGYPGIVFACLAPETTVHLIEPLQKRARLLDATAKTLGLANVTVLAARAEDAGRGPLRGVAELVTARAVAPLAELLEYTVPFATLGGALVLPKGSALEGELAHAHQAMAVLACAHRKTLPMRPAISENVVLACFEKTGETPSTYPRRAGIPGKQPL